MATRSAFKSLLRSRRKQPVFCADYGELL